MESRKSRPAHINLLRLNSLDYLDIIKDSSIDARTCDLGRWNGLMPRNASSCGSRALASNLR
jgi:hypothetical protein